MRWASIEIAPTKASEAFDAARATIPNFRQPDLGERAVVEVIEEPDRLIGNERGILLCEETTVLKRVVVRDRERIVEISALDFLSILEAEQRIQSAEAVFCACGTGGQAGVARRENEPLRRSDSNGVRQRVARRDPTG